jgi:hypothetical protein
MAHYRADGTAAALITINSAREDASNIRRLASALARRTKARA